MDEYTDLYALWSEDDVVLKQRSALNAFKVNE